MISSLAPRGVDVGGVDQVAAGLEEPVELLVRPVLVGLVAEGHGAQREGRHDGAARPRVRYSMAPP